MEHFIVSARKYRPKTFEDVVGQKAITGTLENAIKNNQLAQALLFTGPRGVGKTTCARILAKRINEASGDTSSDDDFAFNIFELDAASNNSVDDIRNLTDQVRIPPQSGNYKVYIIDEVHMLSQAAFNAFLKTLEEPPAHAIFILATTEKHKIIPTILSRCQIFDFKRIGIDDIKQYLHKIAKKENIVVEDDALHIIAQKADGALRDALSIFDRVVSFTNKNLTRKSVAENLNVLDYEAYFKITDLLLKNDIPNVLIAYNDILGQGFDGHHFISGLATHFRDLLVAKDPATVTLLEVGAKTKEQYATQSQSCNLPFLIEAIALANDCELHYKNSKNQRLLVELCLMQLASLTKKTANTAEKKNRKNYIIPAVAFKAVVQDVAPPKIKKKPAVTSQLVKSRPSIETDVKPDNENPKPVLKNSPKRSRSALSLNSIHKKKPALKHQPIAEEDIANKPKDAFTETQLLDLYQKFTDRTTKKGGKLMASILNAVSPKVVQDEVVIHFPNSMMKAEFLKIKPRLKRFLQTELNNYHIKFKTIIDEKVEEKFAYTPQEKYEKLLKKNKALAELKRTFKLDL
ncbi:MAG: DNA polymerase III subunit gamma/tau [Flavobacteriales bacterium]|nr:MAG: DNA polymerase III subunit gamma/tau [Flavobacteriales bacterium]